MAFALEIFSPSLPYRILPFLLLARHIYLGIEIGKPFSFSQLDAKILIQDRPRRFTALRAALDPHSPSAGTYVCEYRVRGSDQKLRWIHAQAQVVWDGETPTALVGACLDITVRVYELRFASFTAASEFLFSFPRFLFCQERKQLEELAVQRREKQLFELIARGTGLLFLCFSVFRFFVSL